MITSVKQTDRVGACDYPGRVREGAAVHTVHRLDYLRVDIRLSWLGRPSVAISYSFFFLKGGLA